MTKKYFIIALFLIISQFAYSQGRGYNYMYRQSEKIKAMKIAYITDKLKLTPKEAEKFWPVYNELQAKKVAIYAERRTLYAEYSQKNDINNNEALKTINRLIALDKEEAALNEEYNKKFLKILTAKKVFDLYMAEYTFKTQLLRKMRGNGHGRGHGRGRR